MIDLFFSYSLEVFTLENTVTLASLLENMGTVLTEIIGWTGEVATAIMSYPILYIPLGMVAISFAFGLLFRAIRSLL